MVTLNNGFQFLDMGPCLPLEREDTFELLEPKLLTILDVEVITRIIKGVTDIELLLASYFVGRMLLITESFNQEKGLLPTIHAVTDVFDHEEGNWKLLDSNQEEIKELTSKEVMEDLKNAYSIKVFEWVVVHTSNDPNSKWNHKLSFNNLRTKLGMETRTK